MNEPVKYPNLNYIYTHYKGGKYQVISLAKHTETGEDMVVYKSLLYGTVFVRPLSMWYDVIEGARDPKRPGKVIKRFM